MMYIKEKKKNLTENENINVFILSSGTILEIFEKGNVLEPSRKENTSFFM